MWSMAWSARKLAESAMIPESPETVRNGDRSATPRSTLILTKNATARCEQTTVSVTHQLVEIVGTLTLEASFVHVVPS